MSRTAKQTGDRGEEVAAVHLEEKGYVILDRNYRFQLHELDLVCHAPGDGMIVFVEVKTRRGSRFGRPEEAVDDDKQASIRLAAEAYLHERRLERARCRFDVVSVLLARGRKPVVQHIKFAF